MSEAKADAFGSDGALFQVWGKNLGGGFCLIMSLFSFKI
jgi:hypothetical protein